jgi:hypothetical protein
MENEYENDWVEIADLPKGLKKASGFPRKFGEMYYGDGNHYHALDGKVTIAVRKEIKE